MKRRESLKAILASSGALLSLPVWAQAWSLPEIAAHSSSFTPDQQTLLASVADTVIPPGNSIGAISVGVDKYLSKLIDDCFTPEVQQDIRKGLDQLDNWAKETHNKSFAECDQAQRETILLKLQATGIESEKEVFNILKNETIRGFNTSREVLVNYHHYKSAPGHYYGCVDVNP